jgi:hypothetical protein
MAFVLLEGFGNSELMAALLAFEFISGHRRPPVATGKPDTRNNPDVFDSSANATC